jgi:flagellar FliJ protein
MSFRLATLLKLRIDDRDRRRRELAQALEAQRILEEQIAALEAERTSMQTLIGQRVRPGSADVDGLLQINRYQIQLIGQRKTLDGQVAQVVAEAERRRQVLVEADRQVRVLEKLREKQAETAAEAALRQEIKDFDEASLVAFRHRQEATP